MRFALGLLSALALFAGPATQTAAGAALKPAGKLRASSVGVGSIVLKWKDRARGERRYEIRLRAVGEPSWRLRVAANSQRQRVRRLKRGTVYRFDLRPCARSRCGARRRGETATLLAPFNGPHPDPNCAILPASDEFNRRIDSDPLHPGSAAIINRILADRGDDLHPDFGSNPRFGIPYVVVPADQPRARVQFTAFGGESDPGPYPIPPGAPIEGGAGADGDRHVLVLRRPVMPGGACRLFELYRGFERNGGKGRWDGDSGAIFNLGLPLAGQRPAGWTSADAAGLPILPGLVRYEEVAAGEIAHAIRITFERTRRSYISPATHWASGSCHPSRPAMGMRLRLRAEYDTSGISGDAAVIATALKRYGAIVADNGSNFFITGSTDSRWNDANLNRLKQIPGSAFEVVQPASAEVSDC